MPRFPSSSALVAACLLAASVALAVASWFAPWAQPAPGTGAADFHPGTASPWGDFEHMIRYADQSSGSASAPASFGAFLFGPAALLVVGAAVTLFAVRAWARAVTTAVVVLAGVAGLVCTTILALAATMYGHALGYGATLAFVGYVAPLTLRFFLPRRRVPATGAAPSG
jgi:hypothetical protein